MGTIQNNHGFAVLDPIRWNGASWVKAGPAVGESFYAQAVVDSVGDSSEFSAIITGTIDKYSHGMLVGYYYLSDSASGEYVDSAPEFAQKLLFVQDSDTVFVYGQPPSGGGGGGGGGSFDFDAAFATKTTDDLAEGVINLYYTTARVESDINDIVTNDFIDALNVNADTLDGEHGAFYLDYNNFTNVPPSFDSADIISLTFDSADVIGIIQEIVTQAFVDGLNVDAAYLGGHDSNYYLNYNNFTNTPTIIDSADVIAIVGDVGVDSATVSAIASQLDSDVLVAAYAYADGKLHLDSADVAAIAGTLDAALPILDSADVAAIAGALDIDSSDVTTIVTATVDKAYVDALNIDADTLDGQHGAYYLEYSNFFNTPNIPSIINATVDKAYVDALGVDADTLDGQQGTFYLDYSNFSNTPSILDSADVSSIIVSDVDKTFVDALNVNADTLDGQHGAYYLAWGNFTGTPTTLSGYGITDAYTTTQVNGLIDSAVSALVDAAPGALDTLNELAAALGDDPNFATTITNLVATKLDSAEWAASAAYTISFQDITNWDSAYGWGNHADAGYLLASQYTAADVLAKLLTVDGAGTGLDADLLDGQHGAYYLNYNNFTNTPNVLDSGDVSSVVAQDVDKAFVDALGVNADTLDGQEGTYYLDYTNFTNTPNVFDSSDVSSIITDDVDKAFVDALGINADTLDGQEGTYYLDYSNFTNTPNVFDSSDVISIIGPHFDSVDAQGIIDSNFAHDVTFGQNVSINGVLYFQADSSPEPSVTGEISWSPANQTLQLGWENSNTHYVGQELCYRGRNTTGSTITKGSLVYASAVIGASGQYRISPYIADGSIITDAVLGLAKEDIPNNSDGYIVYWGRVRGIDTSAFSNGDYVYGSPTTPGAITGVLPTPPNEEFFVGQVINSHANNGSIQVRVVNGLRMEYLHNVWVDSDGAGNRVANHNDALIWDSAVGHWRNTQIDYSILANTPIVLDSADVSAIIVADVDTTFVNNLNVDAVTLGGHDSSYYLDYDNLTNTPNVLDSADVANIASVTERKTYYYSAVGAQSSFSGVDDRGQTMSYDSDNIDVFLNGVLLDLQDFTANDGLSVVLDSAADSGDLLTVQSYAPFVQTVTNVNDLYDINAANPNHRDIMQYDSNVGQWTLVPVNDFRIDVYDANGVLLNV